MRNFIEYDARREFAGKAFKSACYAPFVSLLFDPRGLVRACCQDLTHSLGNIADQRLSQIWHGASVSEFRRQLVNYELPSGCATCQWAIELGDYDGVFARHFDSFGVESSNPEWPQSLWFALSNTCNLECVQCFGDFSSSIRKNRERLPALPKVYGDEFFADLRPFLPHLKSAVFIGGEPFLCREISRVFDMMIEDGIDIPCFISTNGTVFDSRVERVLERLKCHITVSLDGATPQTVESIRRNASFEVILRSVKRFIESSRARNTSVQLSYCLMPQNQHEFSDFLMLAEELGCEVSVNRVNHPPQFSMSGLTAMELRAIVEDWEARSGRVESALGRHRDIWSLELSRLRNQLSRKSVLPDRFFLTSVFSRFEDEAKRPLCPDEAVLNAVRLELAQWSGNVSVSEIVIDRRDAIVSAPLGFAGLRADQVRGRSMADVLWAMREVYGLEVDVSDEGVSASRFDRVMNFHDAEGGLTQVRYTAVAQENGASVLASVRTAPPVTVKG